MQVIHSKTLKTFALLNLFVLFLAPSTSLRVNSKRNKKTPGCRPNPGPLQRRGGQEGVFCSLIFARLCYAKIYATKPPTRNLKLETSNHQTFKQSWLFPFNFFIQHQTPKQETSNNFFNTKIQINKGEFYCQTRYHYHHLQ
jgi:hypothetical protein